VTNKLHEGLDAKLAEKQRRTDELNEQRKQPTPGPLTTMQFLDHGVKSFDIYAVGPLGSYVIAQKMTEGDARLMSASLGLFDAVKAAIDFFESGSGDLDEHQRHECKVKAQLEDALAKAEGTVRS
jgi:hypothetical protein